MTATRGRITDNRALEALANKTSQERFISKKEKGVKTRQILFDADGPSAAK